MNNNKPFDLFLEYFQARIANQLKKHLPSCSQNPDRLHQAMHYAVFNGGKRLRPLLVYAAGDALGAPIEVLDRPAVAVEFIHCYSLVHDDLPAMDDDNIRRGQPTCHKAFNEATAILVGDALQSLAFSCLNHIQMTNTLATASGSLGMAGGQYLDLAAEGKNLEIGELELMHRLKTGALIEACIELGIIAAGYHQTPIQIPLQEFARNIGIAFQIQDDILDVEGNSEDLGKTAGIDIENNKATYTRILGLNKSKERLQKHYEKAISALKQLSFNTRNLEALCALAVMRKN